MSQVQTLALTNQNAGPLRVLGIKASAPFARIDSSRAVHGFVRDAAGNITTFDVPNSSSTFTSALKAGVITGFADVGGVQQGYVVRP